MGDIAINLFDEQTPLMVLNFAHLARGSKEYYQANANGLESGPFYNNSSFHCVMEGYFIQGGCPTNDGLGHAGFFFDGFELNRNLMFDRPFRVAYANWGPDKNSSQFIITVKEMMHLNPIHPIFGEVADSISKKIVMDINSVPAAGGKPIQPVTIDYIEHFA